jgi:hypothetical protein
VQLPFPAKRQLHMIKTRLLLAPVAGGSGRVRSLAGRAEFFRALGGLVPLLLGPLLDVPQVAELGQLPGEPGFGRLFQSFCLMVAVEHF